MSIDLTLGRIRQLAAHLPSYTRPTCHITGTNGKGSVSAILSSILCASLPPLSVGRFNSPHLVSVYDSIVINQKPVTPALYSSARAEVETADRDHGIGASSFELLTMTALLVFERCHVDIAVIEVGMGGRLDATNVIPDDYILVSALCAVDLDHQTFLGPTVVEITKEKAGIARRGRPFVIGRQSYPEVEEVARRVAADNGADVVLASAATKRPWDDPQSFSFSPSDFRFPPPQPVQIEMPCFSEVVSTSLPLHGEHQLDNLGLASMIISTLLTHSWCTRTLSVMVRECITSASVARGVKASSWPGRLSFHMINVSPCSTVEMVSQDSRAPLIVLVDGAHNPSSSSILAAYLLRLFSLFPQNDLQPRARPRAISLTFIIALSHSPPKTPLQTLSPVLQLKFPPDTEVKMKIAVLRFTPPEGMPWVTSIAPSGLRRVVHSLHPNVDIWAAPDGGDLQPDQILHRAFEWAVSGQSSESEELVVLFGSLYLVADFYRLMREDILTVVAR